MPLSCYDPVYDVGFCGATQTADSCTNESRSSYADCQLTHFLGSVYTPSVRRSGTIGKRVALWIVRLFVEAFDLFSKVLFNKDECGKQKTVLFEHVFRGTHYA